MASEKEVFRSGIDERLTKSLGGAKRDEGVALGHHFIGFESHVGEWRTGGRTCIDQELATRNARGARWRLCAEATSKV
eukprot:7382366-Prymnesium_polylepis.4